MCSSDLDTFGAVSREVCESRKERECRPFRAEDVVGRTCPTAHAVGDDLSPSGLKIRTLGTHESDEPLFQRAIEAAGRLLDVRDAQLGLHELEVLRGFAVEQCVASQTKRLFESVGGLVETP